MREIKFRAWEAKTSLFAGRIMEYIDDMYWFEESGIRCMSDDGWVFMQYTGLKDKNGKEIYEGDVVRYENGRVTGVTWDNDTYSFQFDVSAYVLDQECGCVSSGEVEVIGNIYENPELMEVENDD